jgi:hypothetical protein
MCVRVCVCVCSTSLAPPVALVNVGGIANVTLLTADGKVRLGERANSALAFFASFFRVRVRLLAWLNVHSPP